MTKARHVSWTLARRLARIQFDAFLVALGVAAAVLGAISLLEAARRTSRHPEITLQQTFQLAALDLPAQLAQAAPFVMFLAAAVSFARLSATREIYAARALGLSPLGASMPAIVMAASLGLAGLLAFNPIAAASLRGYAQVEASLLRGQSSSLDLSQSGLWLRQTTPEGYAIIHALRVHDSARLLEDCTVFFQNAEGQITHRMTSPRGELTDGAWVFRNAEEIDLAGERKQVYARVVATSLTPLAIRERLADPATLSWARLPGFIATAEAAGFSSTRHRAYLASLLATPLWFGVMAALGFITAMRPRGPGHMLRRSLLAAALALGVYFVSALARALAGAGRVDPVIGALIAPMIGAAAFYYLIARLEEEA